MPGDPNTSNEWLNLSQVAEILGVHPSTLRNWSNQGSFPVHRTQGGHRRYLRNEVDLWLESQRSGAASEHDLVVQKVLKSTRLQISEGRLQGEKWYSKLDDEARELYRQSSRTLLQGLIGVLASGGESADVEAHAVGYEYASRGRRLGLSVADSASAFLFFRNVLIESILSMYAAASVRSPDAWSGMFRKVTSFTDQILISLLETYEALERGSNR
jgi:excisionase family DNA binding protein